MYYSVGRQVESRFCNFFLRVALAVGPVLQLPCCPAEQGELSEICLQNLLPNLTPHAVQYCASAKIRSEDSQNHRIRPQFPFDASIVKLKTVDYINASWIGDLLPGFRDRLIVTIGPMHPDNFSDHPDTCRDFWGMVAELGIRTVVMLGAGEKGYAGCARYFPDGEGEAVNFGKFEVRVLERTEMGDHVVVRKLRLKGSLKLIFRVTLVVAYLGWVGIDLDVPPTSTATQPILPSSPESPLPG